MLFSINVKGQTITYSGLISLVDNVEYLFDSYELLENKGFELNESLDYAKALDLETEHGKENVRGCKMTYYANAKAKIAVNVHSCPPGKNIPMSEFDTKKYVGVMFKSESQNYNYLIGKIKENCTAIKTEPFEVNSQIMTHTYKHKSKPIFFHFYKYLQDDGMFYVIYVAM